MSNHPEVDLDPAGEHVARHVSTAASAGMTVAQHAANAALARARIAEITASAQARTAQRALVTQRRMSQAAGAWVSAATHRYGSPSAARHADGWETILGARGVDLGAMRADPVAVFTATARQERLAAQAETAQWSAYADGAPAAAVAGMGVSMPPEQVLERARLEPDPVATAPYPGIDTGRNLAAGVPAGAVPEPASVGTASLGTER
jgi:hypothetical protein